MGSRQVSKLVMVLGIILLAAALSACDEVEPTSSEADINRGAVASATPDMNALLQAPTRTVKPIVSFTPRFTATPLPSATYTPSITPSTTPSPIPPSLTPTITPSITPTVSGVIRSVQNVNLREGPGEEYDIVLAVAPGTELGVTGLQIDSSGREWYKVEIVEDGEVLRLWVLGRLLDTQYTEIVVEPLLNSPTPQPAAQADADEGDDPQLDEDAGPTPVPERIEVLAYCRQKNVAPPTATTRDVIYIEWSWFVAAPEFMTQHLENVNYTVTLDGEPLEGWQRYEQEMRQESGRWITYWYYPVGQLEAGEHEVTYRVSWEEPIEDGYDEFGPGTATEAETGNCIFQVTE